MFYPAVAFLSDLHSYSAISGFIGYMDVTDVLGGRREPGISAEDVIAQVDFDTPTGKRAAGCAASAGSSDDEVSRGRVTLSVYFSPVKWPRGK